MKDFIYRYLDDMSFAMMSYSGDEEVVTFPFLGANSPIKILSDHLFDGHSEIKEVILPDTLTDIGGFVFDKCSNLKTVVIPNGVENMWQYAFARSGIEEIEIPGSIRQVIAFTFFDCKKLKKVKFNPGTRSIRKAAFKGCTELTEVLVPESVLIEEGAFEDLEDLNIIRY